MFLETQTVESFPPEEEEKEEELVCPQEQLRTECRTYNHVAEILKLYNDCNDRVNVRFYRSRRSLCGQDFVDEIEMSTFHFSSDPFF